MNTQSMGSTFDEIQVMINENQFDISTLSETWRRNSNYLLDYVKMRGYNFVYKNREQKSGGGVGAYLKEELDFKVSEDLSRLDATIEQLWLEIKRKNKNSSMSLKDSETRT